MPHDPDPCWDPLVRCLLVGSFFIIFSFLLVKMLRLVLILLCLICHVQCDNPTSIIKPYAGPDPGYILAESTSGLSNRLRVMAAYMYIGEWKFNGAHLVFIWDKTSACPGHFLSVFEPIPGVVFATNSSRYVLDKNAKIVYENSFAVFNWIMQMNQVPKQRFGLPTWAEAERKMYSKYYPTREVMMKATAFVEKHNICNASAMHLRTTDLDKQMNARKRTHLPSYFKFVESRPAEEKVFILTDNPKTQRVFLNKYGADKVLFYSLIPDAEQQPPLFITRGSQYSHRRGRKRSRTNSGSTLLGSSYGGSNNSSSNNYTLPEDHRFTGLEHTLIDVIIAAHAKVFKPSGFSSLSDLVARFESIGKQDRGWCA